ARDGPLQACHRAARRRPRGDERTGARLHDRLHTSGGGIHMKHMKPNRSRVLLVDVEADGLPHEIELARSVAEAGALLAAREFDAVVSASALPDGTALDVFELAGDAAAIVVDDPERYPAMLELKAGAFVCLPRQAS